MKKFRLLFLALVAVVSMSAWADVPADGTVSRWTNYSKTGYSMAVETSSTSLMYYTSSTSDAKQLFLLEEADGGKHYFRSVYNGRYVTGFNSSAWRTATKSERGSLYLGKNGSVYTLAISPTAAGSNKTGAGAGASSTVVGAAWGGTNSTSWWSVKNVATVSDYNIIDIVVTGLDDNGSVNVSTSATPVGATYLHNGEAFFFASSTSVTAADFSATAQTGYGTKITLEENVLTVAYIPETLYTVAVTGCAEGGIIYDGTTYSNGNKFATVLDETKLSGKPVEGYDVEVTVSGSTITAAYTATFVEVTISDARRGTFVSSRALDFTDLDITASVCTGLNQDGKAVMEYVNRVPAGTPLYVGADVADTYKVPVYEGDDFDNDYANCLAGNLSDAAINIYEIADGKKNYILQKKAGDTVPKFYVCHPEIEGGNTVGAGRCYLQVPVSASEAKEVIEVADGDATAINEVDIAKANAKANAVYDLSGRKISADYKGIVIINGRKEIRK